MANHRNITNSNIVNNYGGWDNTPLSDIMQSQAATTASQPWSTNVDDDTPNDNMRYFSYRNAFRTHGIAYDNDMVTPNLGSGSVSNYPFDIEFDENSFYTPLIKSDWFLREVGGFYYCLLCGKRGRKQNEMTIPKHLESQIHNEKYIKLRSDLWDRTPSDKSIQLESIEKLTSRWLSKLSLTDQDLSIRYSVIRDFEEIVTLVSPECYCRVIGSLNSRTCLNSSDINIELLHPNSSIFESDPRAKTSIHHQLIDPEADFGKQTNMHTLHYDLIPNAVETLYKIASIIEQGYTETRAFYRISDIKDLNNKIPKLILQHQQNHCTLEVVCYADSCYKLTELLKTYIMLDDRARDLCILVKHWANICKIANPDSGSYPPDAFIILVIYFLQRTTPPVLPCIHEMLSKNQRGQKNDTVDKEPNSDTKINGFTVEVNSTDQGQEDEDEDEEDDSTCNLDFSSNIETIVDWSSENTRPTHALFIDFLLTMSKEFELLNDVISIRTLRKIYLRAKRWKTSVKAIENPIKPRNNLSMSIGTLRTFSYIQQCFKYSYYYLTSVPLTPNLAPVRIPHPNPEDFIQLYINPNRLDFYFKMKEKSMRTKISDNSIQEMINQNIFARDVDVIRRLLEESGDDPRRLAQISSSIANAYKDSLMSPRNSLATSYCWLCRSNGHDKKACTRGTLEDLKYEEENYKIELDYTANLDSALQDAYLRDLISDELAKQHRQAVTELTEIIVERADIDCVLQLYGSTVNNLGSSDSDLDICMTLQEDKTGRNVDCVAILKKVHDVLQDHPLVRDLEPRFSARVPILTFYFRNFDIDLSMYNQCAIYNSKLLKKYSSLDERVPQLIYLVKRYAKACQIADASKGTLSSYAWSLMVIHYLQNIAPPVLPILQEPKKGENKPLFGVNGWNVWFRDDFVSTDDTYNESTITQLLKGFFIYYANFEFDEKVISIRMRGSLSKFKKNWHNCMMAIEDPFELTYNLASRLDNPMAIYIINSFAKTYRHIIGLQEELSVEPEKYTSRIILSKLFDGHAITRSIPPFRGCRVCHRIGHNAHMCPDAKKKKKGNRPDYQSRPQVVL